MLLLFNVTYPLVVQWRDSASNPYSSYTLVVQWQDSQTNSYIAYTIDCQRKNSACNPYRSLYAWLSITGQGKQSMSSLYACLSMTGTMKAIHIVTYTIQLYCLCVEKFAFWLVIYIKTFNKINNKTSTTQWNTELKTAQIQGKYLTITMYTHTHARTHARSNKTIIP